MSKGNRSIWLTSGLTLIAAFAIGGYILGHQLGEEAGKKDAHTQEYERHAADEIERTCLRLDSVAEAECIVRVINSAHEHKRAESDLIAQRNMARWAFWMLIATFAMAAITALGVYWIRDTLLATKDAVGAASETNKIMLYEQRPWLVIDIDDGMDNETALVIAVEGNRIEMELPYSIRNYGKNPAYGVRNQIHVVRADIFSVQDDVNEFINKQIKIAQAHQGTTVRFPYENEEDRRKVRVVQNMKTSGDGDMLFLFSCVSYRLGHDIESERGFDIRMYEIALGGRYRDTYRLREIEDYRQTT